MERGVGRAVKRCGDAIGVRGVREGMGKTGPVPCRNVHISHTSKPTSVDAPTLALPACFHTPSDLYLREVPFVVDIQARVPCPHLWHLSTNMCHTCTDDVTLPVLLRPPRPVPKGDALCVRAGRRGLRGAVGRGSNRLGGWRSGGVHRPRHLRGVHGRARRQGGQGAGKCGPGRRHRWHHPGKAARLSVVQNMGRVVHHPPCHSVGSFKQHRHQAVRCCKSWLLRQAASLMHLLQASGPHTHVEW